MVCDGKTVYNQQCTTIGSIINYEFTKHNLVFSSKSSSSSSFVFFFSATNKSSCMMGSEGFSWCSTVHLFWRSKLLFFLYCHYDDYVDCDDDDVAEVNWTMLRIYLDADYFSVIFINTTMMITVIISSEE